MPRAVVCRELGPPERLRLETFAPAQLAPGEVRVAVHAAGINFPDILMAAGEYQLKPELPFTPGVEAAGEVIARGGFGSPTIFLDKTDMYFGNDRMPLIREALQRRTASAA